MIHLQFQHIFQRVVEHFFDGGVVIPLHQNIRLDILISVTLIFVLLHSIYLDITTRAV